MVFDTIFPPELIPSFTLSWKIPTSSWNRTFPLSMKSLCEAQSPIDTHIIGFWRSIPFTSNWLPYSKDLLVWISEKPITVQGRRRDWSHRKRLNWSHTKLQVELQNIQDLSCICLVPCQSFKVDIFLFLVMEINF